MTTWWLCEECGRGGEVEHDPHLDVYSGLLLILEAHAIASEGCCGPDLFSHLRVSAAGPVQMTLDIGARQ